MTHTSPCPRRYAAIGAGLLTVIALLSLYAMRVDHAAWEVDVMRDLQRSGVPGLRPVSITLAVAGAGVPWMALLAACAAALWALGSFRLVLMLGVVAAMQDVGAVLKLVIERARPADASLDVWRQVTSYSFPSGHTLGATLVFGFLFFAIEHCALPARARLLLRAGCVIWILLMGLGRMELGAHWPTDVLGAYLLGALLLLPVVFVLRRSVPRPRAAETMPRAA